MAYGAKTLIASDARLRILLPQTRSFQTYGVKPALVKAGMNAIAEVVPQWAEEEEPARAARSAPAFDTRALKRRVKL